jgi:hypothetical protein
MDLAHDYRISILDTRDAELALAAERARVAAERAPSEPGGAAGGSLLSRLRRHRSVAVRAVTR